MLYPKFYETMFRAWNVGINQTIKSLWATLKTMKREMEIMHMEEFQWVKNKIIKCKEQLDVIKCDLASQPLDENLLDLEREMTNRLKYMLRI